MKLKLTLFFFLPAMFADTQTILGEYYFDDNGTSCPHNPNTTVVAQPANATFSAYSTVGTTCAQSNYQFNNSGWNTGSAVDITEYNQFSITAAPGYLLNLSLLNFGHRTNSTTFCNWHLRSSLDNFTSDIMTGQTTDVWEYTDVTLSNMNDLTDITFRFYVTNIDANASTWRQKPIIVYGSADISGVGLNEEVSALYFFPNPSSGSLNLELTNGIINDVIVYDNQGKSVKHYKYINAKSYLLNMDELDRGFYTVDVGTPTGRIKRNWIKE